MTKQSQIYKCHICGNIIEVLHTSSGELVCCGAPMELIEEQSTGEYAAKHAPVLEETKDGTKVKVGAVEHPMQEDHYIEWIEIETEKGNCRKFLTPTNKPESIFQASKSEIKSARMYCSVHGLWIS